MAEGTRPAKSENEEHLARWPDQRLMWTSAFLQNTVCHITPVARGSGRLPRRINPMAMTATELVAWRDQLSLTCLQPLTTARS